MPVKKVVVFIDKCQFLEIYNYHMLTSQNVIWI